jgi:arabinofuranosyltransferase
MQGDRPTWTSRPPEVRGPLAPAVRPGPAGWLAWLAAAALLAWSIARVWPFTVDDTYITLRYARNLAAGLGPTFNAGGPRAEGCTTFLWMALLAVPHALHLDALVTAKALGVLATLGTFAVTARWAAHEAGGAAWAAAAAALLLAALPATAVHAVSGMETALFTLLVTASFALAAAAVRGPGGGAARALPALLLAAALTRPEGLMLGGIVLGVTWALLPSAFRGAFARRAALAWLVPLAAFVALRWWWYGLPFALPFYVKVAAAAPFAGWPVVREWLASSGVRLGLLAAFALARPARPLWPALAAAAAYVLFLLRPEHVMGYQHRYLAPLDPLLAVLAVAGLARLGGWLAGARVAPRLAMLAPLALAAAVAAWQFSDAPLALAGRRWYAEGLARAHEPLGRALARVEPAGRLLVSDAGAIPYLSRWWTLDMVGLNDARIATTRDRSPASLLAAEPDVVVLVSLASDRFVPFPRNPWEGPLYSACLARGFVPLARLEFTSRYWLWALARPDSPAARVLRELPAPAAR